MRRSTLPAGLIAVLVLASASGCGSAPPPATTVEPHQLGASFPRHDATAPTPSFEEPVGELSLQEALGLALVHNPNLLVYSLEIRAREAEALQAGVWPNPDLGAELENFGGSGAASGFDGAETTLALSQLVELGGKRSKRLSLATLDRDLAAWDYESVRIDVLTETTKRFIAVVAAQEQLLVADELVEVAADVLEAVARRVRAGGRSPVEENRARVTLETTRIDRARRVQDLSVARNALAAQWGSIEPQFQSAEAELEKLHSLPALSTLAESIEHTPALARWTTEVARRQAVQELAASGGTPDLSIGAGLRHFSETGDLGAVVGLSLPLPLFDRKQGAVEAAQSRVIQADHARLSVTTATRVALQAELAEAQASFDEATALRDRVVPEAESAFTLAQDAYGRGRMRLTDVLDTERTLFELRARLVDAMQRYHTAVAELERLAGVPLADPSHESRRR